jgi:hypothetical protein
MKGDVVQANVIKLRGLVALGLVMVVQTPARAEVNINDVAAVCSGREAVTASGGRGKIGTSGYEFEVTADKNLVVTQSGKLIAKIEKFTYQDYMQCLSSLVAALTPPPPPGPKACRDPSHGLERYQREFDVSRDSGWRGGGYDPGKWCNDVISGLRGEHPQGAFSVVSSGENSESKCLPFNCPQYNYSCTVHVKTDPLYIEKVSSACK